MKNSYYECARQRAKTYLRKNPPNVDSSGLHTHHTFEPDCTLSWWQDISFILNKRQVMLWWKHPRLAYKDAIDDEAWKAAGEMPDDGEDPFAADPDYKRLGRSRKKIISYTSRPMPKQHQDFYDHVNALHEQLEATGIERTITPSFEIGHYGWCTGVDICVPIEIRTHADGVALIALARRLLTRQTTCANEFPGYTYGKDEWLGETEARVVDAEKRRVEFARWSPE